MLGKLLLGEELLEILLLGLVLLRERSIEEGKKGRRIYDLRSIVE